MTHNFFVCNCGKHGCIFCDGGLGWCKTCNGFEGTLTTDCCGVWLYQSTLEIDIYKRGLDFLDTLGWIYPEAIRHAINL